MGDLVSLIESNWNSILSEIARWWGLLRDLHLGGTYLGATRTSKSKVSIVNRSGVQDKGWLNTFLGKIVVGVIIGVAVALIIAYFKIQS